MDNNEIFIRNENEITIYNLQGIAKFNYKFDEVVYNFSEWISNWSKEM